MPADPDPDDLFGVSIPDDASSLAADRWRYYDELAAAGMANHPPDQPSSADHPSRWREGLPWFGQRGSHIIPMLFMIAAVAAMLTTLAVTATSRTVAPAATEPLALGTDEVGVTGGLLPSATVTVNNAPRLLRDIRPAVIALIPAGECPRCWSGIANAAAQAEAARVRFLVAVEGFDASRVEAYAASVRATGMRAPVGTFAAYRPAGLTVFVVAPDGVVEDIVTDADQTTNLATTLGQDATDSN